MSIGILPIVNSIEQNRIVKPGISVGSHIIMLTNNQIKSRKKNYSHKRRKSDDKNAVANVKTVPQLGCLSQDSESLDSQRGRQSGCESIRESPQRTTAWKNTRQPSSSAKSRRYEIEDRSQEETVRQQRCAQSKAWNLAKNVLQAPRKGQDYILLALGYCRLHQ